MASEPNFTLNQLRYFSAVAEVGNIKAAASNLHIAQSAVSTAIANLEAQLSIQLFIRNHAKGVELTQAGEQFLLNTRQVLKHLRELGEFGRDLGSSLSGDLVIGCFEFIAPFVLPAPLAEFGTCYPNLRVRVHEDDIEGVQESLLRATVDIGLLYDVNLSPRLTKKVVANFPPYLILPPNHRLAKRKRIALAELEGDPFIQIGLPHSRDYSETLAQQSGIKFNIAFSTNSFEMVRSLVGHGHGYSILNQRRKPDITYDGCKLAICEIADQPPPIKLVLAYVSNTILSKRATAFIDFYTSYFRLGRGLTQAIE